MGVIVEDRTTYRLVLAPDQPCWVATNCLGAEMLSDLAAGSTTGRWALELASRDGLSDPEALAIVEGCALEASALWRPSPNGAYEGRAKYLRPTHLRELWLHTNNQCNFSCRHCLVSSGPDRDAGLPGEVLDRVIDEARELGVVTFFFTGGEPLLRPDLPGFLHRVLSDPQAHAVVLTNGSLINDTFLAAVEGLDRHRLHLQVSLDGSTAALNDELRSPGAFERTCTGIRRAIAAGIDTTVATVVLEANLGDLPALAGVLSDLGVRAWHLMWQHLRERGAEEAPADVEATAKAVLALKRVADAAGVTIDNFENIRAVVNGEPGTKRDGTNACWDSLAIYADGNVYPSAALVGIEDMSCGSIVEAPLRDVWMESPRAQEYRSRSVLDCSDVERDAFLLLHGGGDPEHAYFFGGGKPCAADPYLPLYRQIMRHVMDEIVAERMALIGHREDVPVIYHVMGQDGLGCPVDAGVQNTGGYRIDFVHSNCVLMQDVVGHSREIVRDYYGEAAVEVKGEICCPVPVDRRALTHIPQWVLERSYGCGSPVFAAEITPGETVVDLGSGAGIECFAASKMVGPEGCAIGVDMTREMLSAANSARVEVAANLGYDNTRFVGGYLESIPLADNIADVVISNCVINLSPEKLKVFAEILRVLKPGGRMIISDVVAGGALPESIRFSPRLKDECIAGALTRDELLGMLTKLGFADVRTVSELPWREVDGVGFFADTMMAAKPEEDVRVLPYVGIKRANGHASGDSQEPHETGCLICGSPLQYLQSAVAAECASCGHQLRTRSRCTEGHFVCDQCHGGDYMRFLHSYLAQCEGTDPVELFLAMRDAHPFPVHGPEHHALVPAAFLIAYHNLHGYPDRDAIWEAVEMGGGLSGGSCAFWGACSAALGVGIAYSTILGATPLSTTQRGTAQAAVSRILGDIAALNAPRCCRRESLLSLQMGCKLSAEFLPDHIASDESRAICDQAWLNQECIAAACPYFAT